jgi:hypothetical protein
VEFENDLVALEERVERTLFKEWRAAGEALEQIRDGKLWKPEYSSFKEYVKRRWKIHRGTAYSYIWAADVMSDLEAAAVSSHDDTDLKLGLKHAALLYRFDSGTRCVLAPIIARLSFRDATEFLLDYMADEEDEEHAGTPDHEPDRLLSALGDSLHTLKLLSM